MPEFNAFGGIQRVISVTGFSAAVSAAEAAILNTTYSPDAAPTVNIQYSPPAPNGDSYIGYFTDRWKIYGENTGFVTDEFKAELVTADDTDPSGTYAGLNSQVGDSPVVTSVPVFSAVTGVTSNPSAPTASTVLGVTSNPSAPTASTVLGVTSNPSAPTASTVAGVTSNPSAPTASAILGVTSNPSAPVPSAV